LECAVIHSLPLSVVFCISGEVIRNPGLDTLVKIITAYCTGHINSCKQRPTGRTVGFEEMNICVLATLNACLIK
jgi:hypothetical protein